MWEEAVLVPQVDRFEPAAGAAAAGHAFLEVMRRRREPFAQATAFV